MIQIVRMLIAALICTSIVACDGIEGSVAPSATTPSESPVAAVIPAVVNPPAVAAPQPPPAVAPSPPTVAPSPPVNTSSNAPIALASDPGLSGLRVRATSDRGIAASDGVGAFRLECTYSHMAFDDPIVYPGKPGASHLHTFFGNTSTNANSDTKSLFAATSSTCAGGIANLTAYWVPAMIDKTTDRGLIPAANLIYYKSGYNSNPPALIRPPPNGLRMVAGNKVTQAGELESSNVHHNFECWSSQLPGGRSGMKQAIPDCPSGGYILSILDFPNCWDGVNLDSVDHRSHMAYSGGGRCPASHPVAIPVVTLNINYSVTSGQSTRNWRLSSDAYATGPGGYTMHGDVWFNWNEPVQTAWMTNCVKAARDCHAYLLGDGRELF